MAGKIQTVIAILFFNVSFAHAQQHDSCGVLLKEISGIYDGQCKDGLADGKGTSIGIDTYTGMFKNGLPEGKGKYIYKNGDIFDGYWSKGLKNGQGKFSYSLNGKKMILKGYWQEGEYTGITDPEEFYRITNQTHIESYSIKRTDEEGSQIRISFIGSMSKIIPSELTVNSSTGNILQANKNFTIYDFTCPDKCSIHYIIRTSAGNWQCSLDFEILKQGKYEVVITN